jgi:hypothetical protein
MLTFLPSKGAESTATAEQTDERRNDRCEINKCIQFVSFVASKPLDVQLIGRGFACGGHPIARRRAGAESQLPVCDHPPENGRPLRCVGRFPSSDRMSMPQGIWAGLFSESSTTRPEQHNVPIPIRPCPVAGGKGCPRVRVVYGRRLMAVIAGSQAWASGRDRASAVL